LIELQSNSKRARIEINLANLPTDHCLRKKIYDYHPSDRDNIRKTYLQKRHLVKKCLALVFFFIHYIYIYIYMLTSLPKILVPSLITWIVSFEH
jgi:hypothetical protein